FIVKEELNLQDKIIATLVLRGDKSSNNSDPNKLYFYPKASLAVNLHELIELRRHTLDVLKLRVAFGESGNFARFGSRFTSFGSTIVGGVPGIEIGATLGNPNVAPERQTELEFGIDMGLLGNRIVLDATYYIKSVADL